MLTGNKSYTSWVDVDLHFMPVVEVIKLNRIFNLFMTLDATFCESNVSMDWHKYPKSRKSIWIQQPETLYIITCHTFPGLGGKTLDIELFYSSIFFGPNVLIVSMPTQTVLLWYQPGLWQSVWLAANIHWQVNLTPGRRLLRANITGSDRWAAWLLARASLSSYLVVAQ